MKAKLGVIVSSLLLAACSTVPAPRFFSLVQEQPAPVTQAANKAVLVQTVKVPAQLDRKQIVLDLGAAQEVQLLNDYQWVAALSEELQQALSVNLTQGLGVPSAEMSRQEDRIPYWRIDVDVQRFESKYGQSVRQEYSWRLSPVHFQGATMLCRISLQQPAGPGVEGLAQAHQELVQRFSLVMMQQMQSGKAPQAEGVIQSLQCLN
ncbi:MAG: PqiC family protein [Paenalcaligenes sp.]